LQDIRIRHVEVLGESSSGYVGGSTTVFGSTAR
jgi:hypothetical protein